MYKKVFDARNEKAVSYGTAEDKLSGNAKMIGGVVAGVGFGIGGFYALESAGFLGSDNINDVLTNQGTINDNIGDLDTQMDSYHNDEIGLLTSINNKLNGTNTGVVPEGYVPANHDHPGMVSSSHAHPDMVPKNHDHPGYVSMDGKSDLNTWLENIMDKAYPGKDGKDWDCFYGTKNGEIDNIGCGLK